MKKGLRLLRRSIPSRTGVRTVDLMKKGLRPDPGLCPDGDVRQNRRPDEEGIKTRESVSLDHGTWSEP